MSSSDSPMQSSQNVMKQALEKNDNEPAPRARACKSTSDSCLPPLMVYIVVEICIISDARICKQGKQR